MGAKCVGCASKNNRKPQYSKQPQDTQEYNPDKLSYKLQKFLFQCQIDNVELINYPYDIISMKFKISQAYECSLPVQRKNRNENLNLNKNQFGTSNQIKWKFEDKFDFRMDEYQIRKSFIKVSIFKQQLIPILQLKLNLYQVITGPYHHDLGLNFENQKLSRLLFDLKISQKFSVLINPLQVSIHLNQQYPSQEFNYSFNAYNCGQKICSSDGSLPQKVTIFSNVQGNYRQLKPQDQCQSPTRIRKGANFNKMIKTALTSELKWYKSEQCTNHSSFKQTHEILHEQMAMPSFKLTLNSSEISKSSLQLILWNIQFNKNISNNQAVLFSDCYILFSRVFENDYLNLEELQTDSNQEQEKSKSKKIKKKLQNRISILEELLIKDGKSIGKIHLKLKIVNQVHFSQLSLHARTQDGIVYMNSMFKNYQGKDKTLQQSESINKIQCSFERIVNMLYSLNNMAKQKKRNWSQFNMMQDKAASEFNILINILNVSLQQSLVFGRKKNLEQIIQKQNNLLEVVQRLYMFLEQNDSRFTREIWKAIISIMKRGQFYLENIGFSLFDPNSSSSDNHDKSNEPSQPNSSIVYPKKVKTALRYQQILYKILITALNYNYQSQRETIIEAQAFKAYGYFRVPKFREQVLKCIVRSQDNLMLDEQSNQMLQSQPKLSNALLKAEQKSSSHLNWQKYFYSHLKTQKRSQDLNSMLIQNFHNKKWFNNLSQRKQSFSIFIQYFANKMAELGKRLKLIRYSYCPGYNKLVKSFIIQMKKRPLVDYQASIIETSTVLLTNHNLINTIIPIVAEKTNLYDSCSVNQFLNILSNYLKYLTENGTKTIPEKFNHTYFFKVIKIILQSEYSYGISKMLVILHTYFECFNDQFQNVLSLYLLSKAFFRLFFHWSFNIRIIFYHLFIIKIYWSKLNGVTQKFNHMDTYQNDNCQIYSRYKKLIKILNTAERQKAVKKKNIKRAQKEQYYVKMRRKLNNKLNNGVQPGKKSQSAFDSSSQHQSQKQRSLNLTRLQTLSELKDGYNRSETLCSTQIKEHLRQIQSSKSVSGSFSQTDINQMRQSLNQKQNDKFSINLRVNKRKMSEAIKNFDTDTSVKQQIQKLNEDYIKLLSLNSHKSSSSEEKPLVYTFFGNQDYELEQISLNQQNKILMGMQQFRETQQFVEKYILQKGVAPHVNLDPEIQLDSNQFKPQELMYNP